MNDATTAPKIINHHNPPLANWFEPAIVPAAPAQQRSRWATIARKLTGEDLLLKGERDGEISAFA